MTKINDFLDNINKSTDIILNKYTAKVYVPIHDQLIVRSASCGYWN